jgi:uncharacterized protein (DUF2062 family)
MTLGWEALSKRLRGLLQLDDPPPRIALALAVGVFISCTPFYGLQTLLSLLVATVARLNKAATVTGTWLNLPWFAPFVYAAALHVGASVVPGIQRRPKDALAVLTAPPHAFSIDELARVARDLSAALLIGTTILGLVAGAVTYVVALWLIRARRRRRLPPVSHDRRAA